MSSYRFPVAFAALLFLFGCTATNTAQSANLPAMNEQITAVVEAFALAAEQHDVAAFETILHPEFRVIATRYPNPETTSILPRAVYLQLIGGGKIGGEAYDVTVHSVNETKHNATVIATLTGEKTTMDVTLLLTQDAKGAWSIISDFPIITPK